MESESRRIGRLQTPHLWKTWWDVLIILQNGDNGDNDVQNGDDASDNDCGTVNPALVKHLGKCFVKLLKNNYSTIDFKSLQTDLGRCAKNQNGNLRWHLPLGVRPPLPPP